MTPSRFSALAFGAVFRHGGLLPHQICIKVEGDPGDDAPQMLLLGGGERGRYPAPSYGSVADVQQQTIRTIDLEIGVVPTSDAVAGYEGKGVFPGYLVDRGGQQFGVVVAGYACIDLSTGKRFDSLLSPNDVYAHWAMRTNEDGQMRTVFEFPIPEEVGAR